MDMRESRWTARVFTTCLLGAALFGSLPSLVPANAQAKASEVTSQVTPSDPTKAAGQRNPSAQGPSATVPEPNPWGDVITFLGTLLAAGVGYLGAILVEKKSWQRRKAEQIREKQLSTIMSIARIMQQAANRLIVVKRKFSLVESNPAATNIGILRSQASTDASSAIAALNEMYAELLLLTLELKVLKVSDTTIAVVEGTISNIKSIIDVLRSVTSSAYGDDIATSVQGSEIDLQAFIDEAIAGLRKD